MIGLDNAVDLDLSTVLDDLIEVFGSMPDTINMLWALKNILNGKFTFSCFVWL